MEDLPDALTLFIMERIHYDWDITPDQIVASFPIFKFFYETHREKIKTKLISEGTYKYSYGEIMESIVGNEDTNPLLRGIAKGIQESGLGLCGAFHELYTSPHQPAPDSLPEL